MVPYPFLIRMPAFDLLVVGAGGGPDETNLSAYLLKPHSTDWEDGVLALEAGSGQGSLRRLLCGDPGLLRQSEREHNSGQKTYSASDIYSFVHCFLLSHAHLDHINSLVLSAGSLQGSRKRIYGLREILQDLELVFSDRIWPNLASWQEDDDQVKLLYSSLVPNGPFKSIFPDISVQAFPLNHGRSHLGQYTSTAFFIRHDPSQLEFLFFGDVEPDAVAERPRTINVWQAAAPKIPDMLSCIFIECSWPSGRKDDHLFGHLTPEHLGNELVVLATEVVIHRRTSQHRSTLEQEPSRKRQRQNPVTAEDLKNALADVRIYIIHCKDDAKHNGIRDVITEQCRRVVDEKELGVKVLSAIQGMLIGGQAPIISSTSSENP